MTMIIVINNNNDNGANSNNNNNYINNGMVCGMIFTGYSHQMFDAFFHENITNYILWYCRLLMRLLPRVINWHLDVDR